MSGLLAGKLSKLEMIAYKDGDYKTESGSSFSVLINPNSFKHSTKIDYASGDQAPGASATSPKFATVGDEEVSFEIVIDGTRIAQSLLQLTPTSVEDQLNDLNKVIYDFNGEIHQPNFVKIVWGNFLFNVRLKSMNIEYTLFKPSGEALRAKAQLSFTGYTSEKTALAEANKSSPDMTHMVTIQGGDTLPLLCHRIYDDSGYYLQVAEINGLNSFQDIKPGMTLRFPPLS